MTKIYIPSNLYEILDENARTEQKSISDYVSYLVQLDREELLSQTH